MASPDVEAFTFEIENDLPIGIPKSKLDEASLQMAWGKLGRVEAMSAAPKDSVAFFNTRNLFAEAVHMAFYEHYPLILSPDVIWLTITQGLANHVDQHAAKLRKKFVAFQGKKELIVDRPDFVLGSPDNDWEGVFPEFSQQIKDHIGADKVELIECDFSTTGRAEQIASHICLMDTVQHYFKYTMRCGCGFPSITLSGTPEDWTRVREKAAGLQQFDLDWWLDHLLPVLDQFVDAAHGTPDLAFWRSLCNLHGGSGMKVPITGWLQVFFPYLNKSSRRGFNEAADDGSDDGSKKQMQPNELLGSYTKSMYADVNPSNYIRGFGGGVGCNLGIKLGMIPPSLSSAPFTYIDVPSGDSHQMAFFAGITSLLQRQDGSLEPVVGWAVVEKLAPGLEKGQHN